MDLADFEFELPPERIAQEPAARRDGSRLLVMRREGPLLHERFSRLPELLAPSDLLVVNDTRVIPARLRARREGTGGLVELLLLEECAGSPGAWEVLLRPGKAARGDRRLLVEGSGGVAARVEGRDGEVFRARFEREGVELSAGEVIAAAEACGQTPLPPYIRRAEGDPRRSADAERYQTIWARRPGAVAAPTAGLHFTPEVLAALEARGVEHVSITLHVGLGTFRPLDPEALARGTLHAERVEVSPEAGEAIERARRQKRRIVAVGTTSVRALESFALGEGRLPFRARTELFIRPGFEFRLAGALVTNFHLPRSSLIMLVAAFAGRRRVLDAYRVAVEEGYRFYSYGDAMFIERAQGRADERGAEP